MEGGLLAQTPLSATPLMLSSEWRRRQTGPRRGCVRASGGSTPSPWRGRPARAGPLHRSGTRGRGAGRGLPRRRWGS